MRPIFLIGFMATGKSTVGPLLAARLNLKFIDLDAVVEQEACATVAELFNSEGEAGFRAREAAALRQVAGEGRQVVALGGGAPCHGDNLDFILGAGEVVCLTASPDEIVARVGSGAARPLLAAVIDIRQEVERRLVEREPYYRRAPFRFDTTGQPPSQVARRIVEECGWR